MELFKEYMKSILKSLLMKTINIKISYNIKKKNPHYIAELIPQKSTQKANKENI